MSTEQIDNKIKAVRRFNRFYTKKIGLLSQKFLGTRFSLTQARILFELAQHEQITASEIGAELDIDAGYLSRILNSFEKDGIIVKKRSEADSRQRLLSLSSKGKNAFS